MSDPSIQPRLAQAAPCTDSDPAETTDRSDDGWRRDELHTALIDSMMAVDDVGGGISRDRAG